MVAEFPGVEAHTDVVLNISFINSVYRFACALRQIGVAIVTGLKWAYHVLTMVMLSEHTLLSFLPASALLFPFLFPRPCCHPSDFEWSILCMVIDHAQL